MVYGKCRGFIECLLFTAGVRHWLCLQRVGMTLKVCTVSFPKHHKNVRKGHFFKGINLREQGRWERRHSNQILEAENFVDNLAWETESQTGSKEAKKQRTWPHIEPQMTRVLGWRGKDKTPWSSVWNKQLAPPDPVPSSLELRTLTEVSSQENTRVALRTGDLSIIRRWGEWTGAGCEGPSSLSLLTPSVLAAGPYVLRGSTKEPSLLARFGGEDGALIRCWQGCRVAWLLWETVWRFLTKLSRELSNDPEVPLLGTYPRKMKTGVKTKTHTQVFKELEGGNNPGSIC